MKKVRRVVGALSSAGILGVTLTLAAGATTVATAGPVIVHAPRIPANGHGPKSTWVASNWSGYAETGTNFTGVSGTWTVPTVTASPSASAAYSSAWIGVDGFNNSNLIQTGTEEDFYNGAAHYNAWWEILPAAETPLPSSDVVNAGDTMSASIYETTGLSGGGSRGHNRSGNQHVWMITIADLTHPWASTFTTMQTYNGAGTSAEWIMEAPQVGGHIATLAPYSFPGLPTTVGIFDNAKVLKNTMVSSGSPPYTPTSLDYTSNSGVMIQNNAQVSTPGDPGNNNTAFNVGYGAAYAPPNPLPPTPTS
jgi:hypothetical protein